MQQHPISAAANNSQRNPADGCTIRTDSHGQRVPVRHRHGLLAGKASFELMSRSDKRRWDLVDGYSVLGPVTQPSLRPSPRPDDDRRDRGAAATLAPAERRHRQRRADGSNASNRIVMTYVSGDISAPHVYFTGVDRRREHVVDAAGDRDRRRPRPLHRAGDLAERNGRVRRLQRVHDAVPDEHDRLAVAVASSSTPTARPIRHGHRSVHRAAPQPAGARAARRRTTSSQSSSATTSTPRRPARTARQSGTTRASPQTARRSTRGGCHRRPEARCRRRRRGRTVLPASATRTSSGHLPRSDAVARNGRGAAVQPPPLASCETGLRPYRGRGSSSLPPPAGGRSTSRSLLRPARPHSRGLRRR